MTQIETLPQYAATEQKSSESVLVNAYEQHTYMNVSSDMGVQIGLGSLNLSMIGGAASDSAYSHTSMCSVDAHSVAVSTVVSRVVDDIKVQVYYCGLIMVVYIGQQTRFDSFIALLRDICKLEEAQLFTVKWVDEEGDPCTMSSQQELDEAIRLYNLNKESELVIHVFANIPERPGTQCTGEDRSIYRRGARRWRKLYIVNGHKYQAKRFARTALCRVCQDRIWGLGRQGYKCLECKIMVHKKCHKFINEQCSEILAAQAANQTQLQHAASFGSQAAAAYDAGMGVSVDGSYTPTHTSFIDDLKHAQKQKQVTRLHQNQQQPPQVLASLKTSSPKQWRKDTSIGKNGSRQNGTKQPDTCTSILQSSDDPGVAVDGDDLNKTPSNSTQIGLDQFNMLKVIGRGSYAKVFLAEHKRTKKCYAMKVIKKSIADLDEDIDWVQTEKHVFEQATNHPFLVGLHSCFQTETRLFFVIEYMCGGDLMYHMQQKKKLPEDHARFYSAEISVALGFLHSRGIIYRDLKLDNVLLDIEGHIKLTDYGMCKEGMSRTERTNTFCGTPNYIAPECLRNEPYGFAIDWWALGVLMYEMMSGASPFETLGENPEHHTEDHLFQVILEKHIRIPRCLSVRARATLTALLQKEPDERLGTHDDIDEIKIHNFFRLLDWELLEQRQIQPPYRPPVRDERDLTNIDELFTREPVIFTPLTPNTLAGIQQNEFEGFEYVNPLILSDEIPV